VALREVNFGYEGGGISGKRPMVRIFKCEEEECPVYSGEPEGRTLLRVLASTEVSKSMVNSISGQKWFFYAETLQVRTL